MYQIVDSNEFKINDPYNPSSTLKQNVSKRKIREVINLNDLRLLTPQEAWEKLDMYKARYYDGLAAMYSGDHDELRRTAEIKTFWQRNNCKCRVHVPIASDIASTSANLMFGQEPTYIVARKGDDVTDELPQRRFEEIMMKNNFANKLLEAAESCAALGDIYMKIRWNVNNVDYPIIDVVQPDNAWAEYLLGELRCVHFFTSIAIDYDKDTYIRAYECYTRGNIKMKLFSGSHDSLGNEMPDSKLEELGFAPEIKAPINEMLAVHIANIRPNRLYRSSMLGRSDLDSIRDLCDALDETFSSWMRDIRLAKAKLIVPAEYLRKKPANMMEGLESTGAWEFDSDIEAYVAMDIDTDRAGGTGITPQQFEIRSAEHEATCQQIIQYILEMSGYSPQSFGIGIDGSAQSGTALTIRERKSIVTKNKKLCYWQYPLESILTTLIRMDASLYPNKGSLADGEVDVSFTDSYGADQNTLAGTIEMLTRAQSASTITKVRMIHPDWSEQQVSEEVELIKDENAMNVDVPDMLIGDMEDGTDANSKKGEEGGDEVNE